MENFKRKFDGIWIPKELWFDQNLTLQEKIFFIEINSFCKIFWFEQSKSI